MYGLSKDLDLNFLKGRQLGQVAIGINEVIFGFDENVQITIYAQFTYFDSRDEWTWKPEPGGAEIAARALALLGATVQNFEAAEDGTLSLLFLNGKRLTILDSSKEYESYDISQPGSTIVV